MIETPPSALVQGPIEGNKGEAIMFIIDAIRGRAGFTFTFWAFWFAPIALLWVILFIGFFVGTDGGANLDNISDGLIIFGVVIYFLQMAVHLTFGVGVILAFFEDGGGFWGIVGLLVVIGAVFGSLSEIYNLFA